MEKPKFLIFHGNDNQYYFRLLARNGEIILQSEGYSSVSGVDSGVASAQANSKKQDRFDSLTATDGRYYFALTASNGEILGRSEIYKSAQSRDAGIESVRANAPKAPIEYLD